MYCCSSLKYANTCTAATALPSMHKPRRALAEVRKHLNRGDRIGVYQMLEQQPSK